MPYNSLRSSVYGMYINQNNIAVTFYQTTNTVKLNVLPTPSELERVARAYPNLIHRTETKLEGV